MVRILGIDYGSKRVGVALTDEEGRVAFPKAVIPNDRHLESTIVEMIAGHHVAEVVIGESKDNRGADNPTLKDARSLARVLEADTGVTIHFEPEYYSSQEARTHTGSRPVRKPFRSSLGDHERKRSRSSSFAPVDAEAAAVILNSFLTKRYGDKH